MVSPTRISHVVLQTNRIPELRDWYCAMLGASVVYEDSNISFISFDDEHHRVAFINPGPVALREGAGGDPLCAGKDTGLHHFAFTFARLADLVESYERNKSRGVLPYWCVNHGPTTSMYYRDPDGNRVELLIDNFPTLAECKAFMEGPKFASNPIGVEFNPDDLAARFRAGVPVSELIAMPK